MVKAIRMPDLHQFKPGFFDLSARCGGWELEHLIIVREAFLPHGCLRLWQGSVAEAGDWLHFRMVPVPLLSSGTSPPLCHCERSEAISFRPPLRESTAKFLYDMAKGIGLIVVVGGLVGGQVNWWGV